MPDRLGADVEWVRADRTTVLATWGQPLALAYILDGRGIGTNHGKVKSPGGQSPSTWSATTGAVSTGILPPTTAPGFELTRGGVCGMSVLGMAVYLRLDGVGVLQLRGWGRVVNPDRHSSGYTVELRDMGELAVSRRSALGTRELLTASIEHLKLTVGTEQVRTGGGWVGGGVGIAGAVLGRLEAEVLNRLTTSRWERTVLGVFVELANGTKRHAVFDVHDLDESGLRDRLAEAIPSWADGYVEAERARLQLEPIDSVDELADYFARIDCVEANELLDTRPALTLRSEASRPFLAGVIARLESGQCTPQHLERVRNQIDHLYERERITEDQAEQVRAKLAAAAGSPLTARQRTRRLEVLSQLRNSGAVSEDEFQAERERILKAPTLPA